jgi:hypothetical protein
MEDFKVMKGFEAFGDLDEDVPDFRLRDELALLLAIEDFLEEIAVIDVLHDDAG